MCGCPPPAVREAATQGIVREHRTCRGLARFPPIDGEGNSLPHKMRRTARGRHQPLRTERSAGSSSASDFRPWLRCFSLIGRGSRRKSLPFDENDDSPHDKSQSREQQRVAPETEDDMKDKQENPCEESRNA